MGNTHHRAVGRATIALLIGLLLVPLLLSGHRHSAREAQGRPCAACLLAHHAPVISTVTAAATPFDVQNRIVEREQRVPVTHLYRSPQAGRAPPSRSLARKA